MTTMSLAVEILSSIELEAGENLPTKHPNYM